MSPFAHPKEKTLKHPWKKAAALCLAAVLCLAPAAQTLNMLWDDLVETAPRPPAARGETAQVLCTILTAVGVPAAVLSHSGGHRASASRLVVPELAACVQTLLAEVPAALERLAALLTSSGLFSERTSQALNGIDWESVLAKLTSVFFHGVTGAVTTAAQVLSSVASAVVSGVVDLVFAIYLLAGKEKLQSQCTEAVILGALCAAASSESRG